ncbi:type II toxin-antitoxin system VapC family toxin [Thiomicrospira cyclica]|uniref:PilT protein domain protein n=1 Tax=Thiomicrospira cyclica (strain DSM 14477 / JCM 11371 / ALM1) TaxID=717773 RepID=F6DCT5_THICA|nr:type II toxin-antitoxin system VapC family toxin [Thiomicrospira cyclica]AEG31671.1 PilT protein domain protein [Thiomicrospira cyclica ALM1]
MKNKYLLDTNVVIYFFNGLTDDGTLVDILRSSFNISIITKIEFLSWQKLLSDVALNDKAIEFISNATVYELDEVVANRTIINRQHYKIKTPDAIIGATAQVHGFEIVTNNVDDFKMLDLKVTTVELK